MFILDLYNFCESNTTFTRQDLAAFIFRHRECERMAKSAEVDRRFFASSLSKEFLSKGCTHGYLDLKNRVAWCRGADRRPFGMDLRSQSGAGDEYIWQMMNVDKLGDEDLFV